MAKNFSTLRAKMSPDQQKRASERTATMLGEMPLQELRHARQLSQTALATTLGAKQATISKMERRADMYVSSLRNFIAAMGGRLEILAHFPDGDVRITQFEEIEPSRSVAP